MSSATSPSPSISASGWKCFPSASASVCWALRKGETDYRISAIPLGGYVKMSGENPMDDRTGDPGEFLSHPRWQRFLVALAGPAMNIMLAVALLTGVYMVHYEYPAVLDEPAVVGWVNPEYSRRKGRDPEGRQDCPGRGHRESELGASGSQGCAQPESAVEVWH